MENTENNSTMELKDVRARNIIDPNEANSIYSGMKTDLDKYLSIAGSDNMAILVKDPKIEHLWDKHIKPHSDALRPLVDEMMKLEDERVQKEKEYKEVIEKCEEQKKLIDAVVLKRNKFITRVSPMIIRQYGHIINEYQQFGSLIEDDGKLFVTVKDWLGSFVAGFKRKSDDHDKKVTEKISPKMMIATDEE